ncbi:MAG: DUF4381 domain-containing protein [Candidatus Sedimenticola sp. (ex Thyasira tokunagai)]
MTSGVTEGMSESARGALRDIHGLDSISWWPLTTEMWLVVALTSIATAILFLWIYRLFRYPPGSWRSEARQALHQLQRNASRQSLKKSAGELSLLLRRIAMARFGRAGQASLEGESWLQWLTDTDPNSFDWQEKGRILITLPYAPDGTETDAQTLQQLIRATIDLVGNARDKVSPEVQRGQHV